MKATVDGITYEGTEEEIRSIVENPPNRPPVRINVGPSGWPPDCKKNWDGSPAVTCAAGGVGAEQVGVKG